MAQREGRCTGGNEHELRGQRPLQPEERRPEEQTVHEHNLHRKEHRRDPAPVRAQQMTLSALRARVRVFLSVCLYLCAFV